MQRVLYKLTTPDFYTRKGYSNQTLWGEGVTHTAPGNGMLCSSAYIHAYTTPLLAILLNPIHANLRSAILWRCVGKVEKKDDGTKVGCVMLKTIKIIEKPALSTTQIVAFGILCSMKVHKEKSFTLWVRGWLLNKDRSAHAAAHAAAHAVDAAKAAANAADDAAYAAYAANAAYAAKAANAADDAAYAANAANAAYAANAANAAYAAKAAANAAAAHAAANAAHAAAYAANAAAWAADDAATPLNLAKIARLALKY
jgi:hypothetical protein